jgi:hypothetical protein
VTWLVSIFRSRRFWGLTGTTFVLYLIVFVGLAHITVPRALSTQRMAKAILQAWPRLPFFSVRQEIDANGQTQTYYTVPTRQITKAELARMQNPAEGNKTSAQK